MFIGPLIGMAGSCFESLFRSPASGAATATNSPANKAGSPQGSNQGSSFAQILDSVQQPTQTHPIGGHHGHFHPGLPVAGGAGNSVPNPAGII